MILLKYRRERLIMENETISRNFIEQIIDKDIEEADVRPYVPVFHRSQTDTFTSDMQNPFS